MKKEMLLVSAALLLALPLRAEEAGDTFTLGEVTVYAPRAANAVLGGSTITQDEIRQFSRDTLDTAIQLVPGATVSMVGARNETNIWLRGFDRFRVPLYIDGIPVYLPADNRIDFSRFSTSDISEIQVSKGFTSVIDGPGALGGSVNLVSREVAKPFEGDMRIGGSFDDNGAFNGVTTDAFLGTRQGSWYVQAAVSERYRNHFRLSDDYPPGTLENGGNRNHSQSNDYKINLKAGYVPSATDEYSLNFIDQMGSKNNALPDSVIPAGGTVRFWDWPNWDKQSVYYLSTTAIDDAGSYVKVRLYYDRFYNVLKSYDDATYSTRNKPSAFVSTYDDNAYGGSAELDEMLFDGADKLRLSGHFRYDQHNAQQDANAKLNIFYSQPNLRSALNTYSIAIENIYHPTTDWDVIAGVSYDYRELLKAQDFNTFSPVPARPPYGAIFNYPTSNRHAVNPELAVIYRYDDTGSIHASVSQTTRFPTLFELFSSRFGTFTGNPNLGPERSLNWETGIADTVLGTHIGLNLFYDRVTSAIESVGVIFPAPIGATTQNRNIGTEIHQGFEIEASRAVLPNLEVGGNYSYLDREIRNNVQVSTDLPRHKLFLYADWTPLEKLTISANIEYESKRTLQNAVITTRYYRGGDFVLTNVKASYEILTGTSIEGGITNLLDANYAIADGYHSPGRGYVFNVRTSF
jgi:iron complex outermembrane receptor protein